MKLRPLILSICLFVAGVAHAEKGDFMRFFYRVGVWLDGYSLRGLDTTYIGLPEHTWRLALTNSEVGIHSTYEINNPNWLGGGVVLKSNTKPSIDLGFQVGLRTFGFGYSWDALHAYAQKLNLSMGGKAWGVELQRQTSGNIKSTIFFPGYASYGEFELPENCVLITNTNLTAWYALNSAHYSHNAAVKQAYIQKRTAGSLLLNLSYMNTDIAFDKELDTIRLLPILLNGTSNIVTHQVAVGVGYGINYTPNNGKVLIHASAMAQAVFYSINYISYAASDSLQGFAYPSYTIKPTTPVHITGTMRAAVSWEINKWVHLSARAQVNNIRFRANASNGQTNLNNWNWQAHLSIGVRLGAGSERVNKALGIEQRVPEAKTDNVAKSKMPEWVTDYFFSARK